MKTRVFVDVECIGEDKPHRRAAVALVFKQRTQVMLRNLDRYLTKESQAGVLITVDVVHIE